MSQPTFAPTYNFTAPVMITHEYDLGSHQIVTLADGTITLTDNKIDMPEYNFQATEAVRLDREEAYKLLVVLQELFK